MTDLSELQARMAEALVQRRALPGDPGFTAFAEAEIAGNDRLSPVEQLEIYRKQFWLRHTSSLVEDFPGLGGIIGQEAWERLVEGYLAAHPPTSFTLRDLGLHLPAYVESATWLPNHALCVDMARLEVHYIEAFDAPDAPPLDPVKLASIPEDAWASARLSLHPSVRLLAARYPVADLRRRLRTAGGEPVPIPDFAPQNLVVYRRELQLFDATVTDGALALLRALERGEPLVRACEAAQAEVAEDIGASLGDWFRDWARKGWITDVVIAA